MTATYMHGPWHPILHNNPRPPKNGNTRPRSSQYVPVIANDYSWYRPLDETRKEIRILFLEPEPIHSIKDVVVHVFNASLLEANTPKLYGCLSYCWGDPSVTKAIQVNYTEKAEDRASGLVTTQTIFQVTSNLEAALRVLRSKLTRPVMWADALCIDQSDEGERSSQVSLMSEIYIQAVQTIVWLGEADSTTKKVFDLANFITKMEIEPHRIDRSTKVAGINCLRLRPLAKGEKQFTEAEVSSDDFYRARWGIQALLARPFFKRAWVLQEVGLADREQIVVHCGEHSLYWQTFQNLTSFEWRAAAYQGPLPISSERDRLLGLPSNNPAMVPGAHYTLPDIWSYLRRYCSNTMRGKIIDLIFRRLEIQATDPRDHIFALFGLAEECQSPSQVLPGFRANYSSDVVKAYMLFTRAVITKLQNLIVLSAVNVFHTSDMQAQHGMPTWVPDYSNNMNLRRTLGYMGIGHYKAAGTTKPKMIVQDPNTLSLSGFMVDAVGVGVVGGPFRMDVRTKNVNNTAMPISLYVDGQIDGINFLWQLVVNRLKLSSIARQELLESFILTLLCSRKTFFDRALIASVSDIPELFADFAAYWKLQHGSVSGLPRHSTFYKSTTALSELATQGNSGHFGQRLYYTCHERSFLITERGLLALVPPGTKHGDLIVVCEGSDVPFVVRKTLRVIASSEPIFEFIGECYVHGRMEGKHMRIESLRSISLHELTPLQAALSQNLSKAY